MIKSKTGKTIRAGLFPAILVIAACGQKADETPAEAGPTNAPPVEEQQWDGAALTAQVSIAIEDLAGRAGVAADAVTVSQARTVNWGSSAAGCPEDGKNYTQAIVPGLLLLLEANGKTYRYHGRTGRDVFYCPDERAVAPAFGPGQEFM